MSRMTVTRTIKAPVEVVFKTISDIKQSHTSLKLNFYPTTNTELAHDFVKRVS